MFSGNGEEHDDPKLVDGLFAIAESLDEDLGEKIRTGAERIADAIETLARSVQQLAQGIAQATTNQPPHR